MTTPTRSTIQRVGEGLALSFERARLVVEVGPDAGEELFLGDAPVILGRGDTADFRIRDDAVSREHAVLRPSGDGWELADLGSKTGTWVNDVRIQSTPLKPGQRIRMGGSELELRRDTETVRSDPAGEGEVAGQLGESAAIRRVFGLVKRLAPADLSVLVLGDTGTGKEGVARGLHEASAREGRFVALSCGVLDRETLRSELFGHEVGAFTGAAAAREGAFRRAHRGTLFLDEIGELPGEIQAALLRVLQEGEVQPLGSDEVHRVRVRVVAATHRDLAAQVEAGEFREDLYYRLASVVIQLPPLRDREDDALLLARHFLPEGREFTPDAEEAILAYDWPGNIRQLRSAVDRGAALAAGPAIDVGDLDLASFPVPGRSAPGLGEAAPTDLQALEEVAIQRALERHDGNRNRAAKELGISRATLFRRLKEMKDKAGG